MRGMPPAPGRLSTITRWPSGTAIRSLISRAMISGAVPAGDGTMNFTGLVGQVCAATPPAAPSTDRIASNMRARGLMAWPPGRAGAGPDSTLVGLFVRFHGGSPENCKIEPGVILWYDH